MEANIIQNELKTKDKKHSSTDFQAQAKGKTVVLFDGVCNLCNGAINFVIDKDTNNQFHFASLQSDFGQALLKYFGRNTADFDSMIVFENGKIKTKSSAALRIASGLSGVWKMLSIFKIVPKFLRDAVYNLIAKNRYNWFGKQSQCRIPTPELRAKFVGESKSSERTIENQIASKLQE